MNTTVSVVICAYTEERWHLILAAVASVRAQSPRPYEITVVVDHNTDLERALRREALPGVRVVPNLFARGLSGARNTGIAESTGDVVAFLDDDARACAGWLAAHQESYAEVDTLGVGGLVLPEWASQPPRWFPPEFGWVVGCSYVGLPSQRAPIRNPIGANMSFRRRELIEIGGFDPALGRVGGRPLGCEETELSIRLTAAQPGSRIMLEPRALVHHHVSPERGTARYFGSRCWAEGQSKASVTRRVGARQALASERNYVRQTLSVGTARGIRAAVTQLDPWQLARVAALQVGLLLTVAGYLVGRITSPPVRPAPRHPVRKAPSMTTTDNWLDFDIHGLVGVRVDGAAPAAMQLRTMLDCFSTDQEVPPDITVDDAVEKVVMPAQLEDELCYSPSSIAFPRDDVQLVRVGREIRIHGKGELLTALVPVLDMAMVENGAAMVHAATVAYRGQGILLPAAGGTGKTSTVAKLTRQEGFSFMGDDWAFLGRDGTLYGYAKPMFIKPHHRTIYPHLFSGPRKPLVPSSLSRPLGHLTTRVHPLVIRYPRLADLSRRWSPEHRMVTAEQALPGVPVTRAAPTALAVYIERYEGAGLRLVPVDVEWMVDRMMGNFHIEMAGFSQRVVTAMAATSFRPWRQWVAPKADVLREGLRDVPCHLMQVPADWSADVASDQVVAFLQDLVPDLAVQDGEGA